MPRAECARVSAAIMVWGKSKSQGEETQPRTVASNPGSNVQMLVCGQGFLRTQRKVTEAMGNWAIKEDSLGKDTK